MFEYNIGFMQISKKFLVTQHIFHQDFAHIRSLCHVLNIPYTNLLTYAQSTWDVSEIAETSMIFF